MPLPPRGGVKLDQRIYQFSVGASNKNILLMVWIFILAGAFAHSTKEIEWVPVSPPDP